VDVTVAVATFGDREWTHRAQAAILSASPQAPVVYVHGATLHDARNAALEQVETEWVVFLDADDQLEAGYVEALAQGSCDLRAPAVRYVNGRRAAAPYVPRVAGHHHACTADCLPHGNWLVVGSAVRADMVRDVGGWWDEPIYEDWSLWLRCWKAGATVEAVPAAIYRAHVRPDSRNRAPSIHVKNRVHRDIVASVLGRCACLSDGECVVHGSYAPKVA
jgi:glycosyltransferase involved in cell wall biosynthesis